uniref:Retrovirus-related Pol polyprotein from transposon TNT 1-94 n=1 Tax=Tanacetum cinerariifolium TaxID=118510 RepID=A0A6L2LKU8_TANCI|nr:retrovirus-related Pol polyprotein from transposon TNT 1-94 [Tanacetum cinerariifolium]
MPPKPDLVFHNAPNDVETVHTAFNVELSPTKPDNDLSHTHRPSAPIIEDWVSDSVDESETKISQNAPMVNAAKGVPRKWEWKPKYLFLDHVTRNTSASMTLKRGGKIFSKGKIRTGKLEFDDVYFVKELKFNLFSISQMCDKKNSVLFTDTECLVLSPKFKLPDENQVLLRVPRENNMYNANLKNIVPSGDLTCLFAKATLDEILVTKPQNKTPYELLHGRTPIIGFMRPFGCPVTIINTLDSLGKFDRKVDEGFLVGYSVSSKAFRVFNSRTRIVQDTLHINFIENKPNVAASGPIWLFDIDILTKTMNYQPVTTYNQSNPSAGVQEQFDAEKAREENEPEFEGRKPEYEVNVSPSSSAQSKKHDDKTKRQAKGKSHVESLTGYRNLSAEFEDFSDNSINEDNAAGTLVPAIGQISILQILLIGRHYLF